MAPSSLTTTATESWDCPSPSSCHPVPGPTSPSQEQMSPTLQLLLRCSAPSPALIPTVTGLSVFGFCCTPHTVPCVAEGTERYLGGIHRGSELLEVLRLDVAGGHKPMHLTIQTLAWSLDPCAWFTDQWFLGPGPEKELYHGGRNHWSLKAPERLAFLLLGRLLNLLTLSWYFWSLFHKG